MVVEVGRSISFRRIWLARGIAICADLVLIVFMPVFSEGIASPLNVRLDVAVGVAVCSSSAGHGFGNTNANAEEAGETP